MPAQFFVPYQRGQAPLLGAKWAKGARPLFQPVSGGYGVRPLFGNGFFISCGGQSLTPVCGRKNERHHI